MLEDGVQTRPPSGISTEILAETDNVTQYTEKQDADSHVYAVMVTDVIPHSWFQAAELSL